MRLQKQNNGELLAALSRETKVHLHLAASFGFLNASEAESRAGTEARTGQGQTC